MDNLQLAYDIKAMFTEAYKNPQFMNYMLEYIHSQCESNFKNIFAFSFSDIYNYIEITVDSSVNEIDNIQVLKAILHNFVISCADLQITKSILYQINENIYQKYLGATRTSVIMADIMTYMYSILNLLANNGKYTYRIML